MSKKEIHLVCNAHLDPVWLWEWEEGAAEALSTFRSAADLCEEFPGFVFNHNEAVLYRWIEEYEPKLFERIRRLIKAGRWRIMGGWYLQPDCNLPAGESFVRQILAGRVYFREAFKVWPTTAMNFDSFGHTRGLVQILARSGYDSYLFCRPDKTWLDLPAENFQWVGFDGSTVTGLRTLTHYLTPLGKAAEHLREFIKEFGDRDPTLFLWGVGNHGGGPSRKDIREVDQVRAVADHRIEHAWPERYFEALRRKGATPPRVETSIRPWAVGCYTSMSRVKRLHRQLENELYKAEKMAVRAWMSGRMTYPSEELMEATRDLLFSEFHDILPGSCVEPSEAAAIRQINHGLEILSRVQARAFFALTHGQPRAKPGEMILFACNPHPYPVDAVMECEFNLPDFNRTGTISLPTLRMGGRKVPCQLEKELSSLPIDWRKRVVFRARLAPSSVARFECTVERVAPETFTLPVMTGGGYTFKTDEIEVRINGRTGLIDRYRIGGIDHLKAGSFAPEILADTIDPWEMSRKRLGKVVGRFRAADRKTAARFAGLEQLGELAPVRVIEDGAVRCVVEAILVCGSSTIVVQYKLPKSGYEIEVDYRVFWAEKTRALKIALKTPDGKSRCLGQTAYGREDLPTNGDEAVAQRWVAIDSPGIGRTLTCINDGTYGCDFRGGVLRINLLRSPAYSAHPVPGTKPLREDRFAPRLDQGEHRFRFWIQGGPTVDRLRRIEREAQVRNESPVVRSFQPDGLGKPLTTGLTVSDSSIVVSAVKRAELKDRVVIRLFESTGRRREIRIREASWGLDARVSIEPFEIRTFVWDPRKRRLRETDLMEGMGPGRSTGK
ncbi:MAG: glycoside hydrolase family 38 C-terminal domain-containing protein [Opitutaceae bacterium]